MVEHFLLSERVLLCSFWLHHNGNITDWPLKDNLLEHRPCRMNPLNLIRERFLVAEDAAGQLVACGQVASIPGDPPIQELRSLVVVKEQRGHGIGTRLLQELLGRVEGEVYLLTIGRA